MNDTLAKRIKLAYPDGLISGLDEAAIGSDERDERIIKVLQAVSDACSLAFTLQPPSDLPAYQVALTQKGHPSFEKWAWQMHNPEKLAWIAGNNGEPYPVFWLKISRVADYFHFFYNHWVPRGNTGHLYADCERQPNAQWIAYEQRIRQELEANGFDYLTQELANEPVPFVQDRDYFSIPDDDPRWDDDDFEPPLVPSTVHDCLFRK